VREAREEVRHLHRRQPGFAREIDRLLGGLRRIAEVTEPLLQIRLQMMEVRPVHAAGRGKPALHRLQQLGAAV
jgi:hypothetical protein